MILKNGLVALPGGDEPARRDIRISGEKIAEIGQDLTGEKVFNASGLIIIPGAIDPHVHFNEPGFTEREDFYSGSSAAASGGITTVIDMPCTSIPPVTNRKNFENKLRQVLDRSVIDFAFFGGVSSQSYATGFPENMEGLAPFVRGFKTYFFSGMESFGRLNHDSFREVLKAAKRLFKPVLLHAEDYDIVIKQTRKAKKKGNTPENFYSSRPEEAESQAISKAITLARETKASLHICHLGTAGGLENLSVPNATFETCPHYLAFDLTDFGLIGSPLKVTPPVKSPGNREALWKLLREGKIHFVSSDHAPCPADEKNTGSIWTDYSGIPGTGTLLPFMFSEGYQKGRISFGRFIEVTSTMAARRYGLFDRKGSIEVGKDADLVLIDPDGVLHVSGSKFYSKGKITPFEGMEFQGKIVRTIVRGRNVYDCDQGICVPAGYGGLL